MVDLARSDDAALVARIALGDEVALGVLHDRYLRLALSVATRLLRDAERAREVVQDAFLDVWRTAPSYDPHRANVTTWIVRLVRLRAIDRLRVEGAQRRSDGRGTAPIEAIADVAAPDDVEASVHATELTGRVRAALEQLPPDQRAVVELAFLEGLTHPELAERLEVPLGTIKTRCFRGLAKLAGLLADEQEEQR
ncbi:MAG: polymerase ECF-type (group 3) sigma factor [Thermoleophilia bacterium]|nr:polymerase ECF-type (group 3) sigma factor [Thermoleophilia bacterium]